MTLPFDNSYARLPERFFARLDPAPVRAPVLLALNRDTAPHGRTFIRFKLRQRGKNPVNRGFDIFFAGKLHCIPVLGRIRVFWF